MRATLFGCIPGIMPAAVPSRTPMSENASSHKSEGSATSIPIFSNDLLISIN